MYLTPRGKNLFRFQRYCNLNLFFNSRKRAKEKADASTVVMQLPDGTWQAAVGGLVLGTAATAMLAATGKLVGLSGIFDGVISRAPGRGWKVTFLSGFAAGGIVAAIVHPEGLNQRGAPGVSTLGLVVSGCLVGLGTRLGSGCTSGHGLCGLPRLSRRSLVAVLTFLTSGIASASVLAAWTESGERGDLVAEEAPVLAIRYTALTASAAGLVHTFTSREERAFWRAHLASFLCGGMFAGGLVLSGMVRRAKVLDFLALRRDSWDPSLAFVLGCGVMTTLVGFPVVTRFFGSPVCGRPSVTTAPEAKKVKGNGETEVLAPSLAEKFEIPKNTELDLPLIVGAWIFGLGWGSSGMCPGPAFVAAAYGLPSVACIFLPSVAVGMKIAGPLKKAVSLPHPSWVTGGSS
ncbi:unnamed protein product [Ascophyllum nodosum]